ncbi:MAG: putative bifunctional diguanylate cyclase/phosphodiesterase [Janthinobacterium lividum]
MNTTTVAAWAKAARRQTSIVIGIVAIVMLWLGVFYKDFTNRIDARHDAEHTEQAYAVMFEENVLRAIGEIDKTLLYMRRMIEGGNQAELFANLATTHDLLSDIIVQVAVLDEHGIMRATNAGPQPPPPKDLSDRPHFREQVANPEDTLYIGQPLIGRASNRVSVQFSRRIRKADGSFAGVVVVSLDPDHFASFLDRVNFGSPASVSLIGSDGIVRADGGQEDGIQLGGTILGTPIASAMASGHDSTFAMKGEAGQPERLGTLHKVDGQPLWVMVSMSESEVTNDANAALEFDSVVALGLTLLIAGVVIKLLRIEGRRRAAEAEVSRSALRDPLTDLPNRRVLQSELKRALDVARRVDGTRSCALLLLDLDRFKVINDTLGHATGDELLIAVSRRVRAALGPDHLLARLGGDEFAVVMRHVEDRIQASELAERLGAIVAEPFEIGQSRVLTGMSIGIAIGPEDGEEVDDLMVGADLALYSAKVTARGRHVVFQPSMKEGLTRRHQLEIELRQALRDGGLSLHFQPSISTTTGRIASFEALARWQHPSFGFIAPTVFIGIAEETGLIGDLGSWALQEACAAAKDWPEEIRLAVNLSPVQLREPGLLAMVSSALDRSGLQARRLELEITEQMLLDNSQHNHDVLQSLKSLGISIAMDDFGTGYSSLNYLQAFPFDRVKVDRAFVEKLGQGSRHTALVRAVVDLASSFGMATTAEGVETDEQRQILEILGCTDIQGFFYARPMPADEVLPFIAQWARRGTVAA